MSGVTVMRTAEAELTGPENVQVYTQIDGEVAGHLPAVVKIVPDALTLLIPPAYQRNVP
jgi:diacylglycerol kinase family enzyme